MATNTSFYNLVKQALTDFYDRLIDNSNLDLIDNALNGLEDNKESLIKNASAKTTPVDADTIPLSDSAASSATKKVSWANIKATLKTYFDTLYDKTTIANNLTTTAAGSALDATQGKALNNAKLPYAGGTMTGALVAQNNTNYTTKQVRNITLSTADASGGANGDIWITYTP